ncbi:MAG TPA: selenide, water dikinase SelD [Bacteroidia bacterium]|nr:selenide, water dikinase SelD [Bacteroidia bacterium]
MEKIKLTQFSRAAGCGCKIAPSVLESILKNNEVSGEIKNLLVGNREKDDAAVLDLGDGTAIISTTDFFMPVVDDAVDFGKIASANAISDVYAMGGTPLLAVAILGWPIEKLDVVIAAQVLQGSREICEKAGIPLAGGHSVDSLEPIFGLAVTGRVKISQLKRNSTAQQGDVLFLTKAIGSGILATALKRGILKENDYAVLLETMSSLNSIGQELAKLEGVHAMTDITGFGLLGHLIEMCEGSGTSAEINLNAVPLIEESQVYASQFCFPDNTTRNFNAYKDKVKGMEALEFISLCDPQTSGGLLVAVDSDKVDEYCNLMKEFGLPEFATKPIGRMMAQQEKCVIVKS